MSSILEALKKLDRERTARKKTVINIEQDILKSSSSGVGAKSRYRALLLALAGSTGVLLLLLIIVWWQPFTKVPPPGETIAVRQKVPAPDSSKTGRLPIPPPTSQAPSVKQKTRVAVPPPVGMPDQKAFQPAKEPPIQARPLPQVRPPAQEKTAAAKPSPTPTVKPATPKPAPQKKTKPLIRPLPVLTVTGIAFREDRSSRLAIINGEPVAIGEKIEGVKVEDIKEDEIRFSFHGRKFKLGIGESTRGR
jgi:general secretion pathway protein B